MIYAILFTDIVGSTERAASLGDRAWRDLLGKHHLVVRGCLARWRGREANETGDGFLCLFNSAVCAIFCAAEIREGVHRLGLDVRCGIHVGEVESGEEKSVAGLAVNVANRVTTEAAPGEIMVTSALRDMGSGWGFGFQDQGTRQLKGLDGTWPLFGISGVPEVSRADILASVGPDDLRELRSDFKRAKRDMGPLLDEMRADLQGDRFVREFFIVGKRWSMNIQTPTFLYYFEDHENLQGQIHILENGGFVVDVTSTNAKRYRFTEPFVRLLLEDANEA